MERFYFYYVPLGEEYWTAPRSGSYLPDFEVENKYYNLRDRLPRLDDRVRMKDRKGGT